MPAPVVPDVPSPCTPGQVFTLKAVCNGEGNGATLGWAIDATVPSPLGMASILSQAIDAKWKPADVHKLAESMKPTPCKCGEKA